MARPAKCRCICSLPRFVKFIADGGSGQTETIRLDEYEVFRLLNLEKKTQKVCADRMQISRPTVARIYESVSEKLARAFAEGKNIVIEGGDVMICEKPRPECADEAHCCHRNKDTSKLKQEC